MRLMSLNRINPSNNESCTQFLKIALETQAICKRYNVPILINDRIDIALAIHADGVHLGQTDMPLSVARTLLPKGSIIGISCNTKEHIETAVKNGADYVGIGAVWGTSTKVLTSPIIGVRGVGEMLRCLDGSQVQAVAIGMFDRLGDGFVFTVVLTGGIKSTNVLRTLHGSVSTTGHALDGVAVVSDIVGSSDPSASARTLFDIIRAFKSSSVEVPGPSTLSTLVYNPEYIKASVSNLLGVTKSLRPLVHQVKPYTSLTPATCKYIADN